MKKISYKKKLCFFLPYSWTIEEDLENDLAIMYPNKHDIGIFRLNLLQAKSSKPLSESTYLDLFESFNLYNSQEVFLLEKGDKLTTIIKDSVENGIEVTIIYWLVANLKQPDNVRLATFSFTTLKSNIDNTEILSVIGMLDNEIRKSKFS